MTATTVRRWIPLLLTCGLVAVLALGAGFVAGRKLPRGLLAGIRSEPPVLGDWRALPQAPFKAFEAGTISIEGLVFVFGGFRNQAIQASEKVWVFNLADSTWTRRRDMPSVRTHANPVLVGETVWFAGGFLGDHPGPATREVWRYDWGTDTWTPGPPLPVARGGGALVAVDGRLHYFGGYLEDRNTNSEDHWILKLTDSLQAATWIPAAPLPKPRGHLSGAAVGGMVYALGGCDGHDPDVLDVPWVHRYDPATGVWTEMAPIPIPRSHFEPSTIVRQGRIILVGGRSRPTGRESVDDVTEYDPATNRWRALAPLPEPRHSPVAVLVGDRILAGVGGSRGSDPDNQSMWLERRESPWISAAPLPVALGSVAGGVIRGRLYVVGEGTDVTLSLDPGSGRWDDDFRHGRRAAVASGHTAEVWRDQLFLFGGLRRAQGDVQIYDPVTGMWRFGPDMPFAAGSSASATVGSMIYVAGGMVGTAVTNQAARFDPSREVWTPIAPMPLARHQAAGGTDGHRFFIFGGKGPGSGDSATAVGSADVQIYDPATDTWTVSDTLPDRARPLPQGRSGTGRALYIGGEFWVVGGGAPGGPGAPVEVVQRVDIYDPVANRWRAGPRLRTARHQIFPLLAADRVYILGGGPRPGPTSSTSAEFLDLIPPPTPLRP